MLCMLIPCYKAKLEIYVALLGVYYCAIVLFIIVITSYCYNFSLRKYRIWVFLYSILHVLVFCDMICFFALKLGK